MGHATDTPDAETTAPLSLDAAAPPPSETRMNGFVAGHGDPEWRRELLADLELSPAALSELEWRL